MDKKQSLFLFVGVVIGVLIGSLVSTNAGEFMRFINANACSADDVCEMKNANVSDQIIAFDLSAKIGDFDLINADEGHINYVDADTIEAWTSRAHFFSGNYGHFNNYMMTNGTMYAKYGEISERITARDGHFQYGVTTNRTFWASPPNGKFIVESPSGTIGTWLDGNKLKFYSYGGNPLSTYGADGLDVFSAEIENATIGDATVLSMTGDGHAYACVNEFGGLYRSSTPCV